jgi:hypothetical protein
MRWPIRLVALLIPLAMAAPAQAGTYVVRACDTPAGKFPNRSWTYGTSGHFDASKHFGGGLGCGPDVYTLIWPTGSSIPPGAFGAITFSAPPETTIADFRISRQVYHYNPANPGTLPPYVLFELGQTPFAGAGHADPAVREAVHAAAPSHWYGYPSQAADTGQSWMSLRDYPALRGYRGDASVLRISTGCAPGEPPCSLRGDGWIIARVFGAEVTVRDNRRPTLSSVRFGPGGATFTATDGAGVMTAQLVDVTDPAVPQVLAQRDFRAPHADGRACDFNRAAPCPPELRDETLAAAVPSGRRSLLVSVVDAAGNRADSDVGVIQLGSPATSCSPGGALVGASLRGGKARRKLRQGRWAPLSGRVTGADGVTPLAGASVQLFTRQLRRRALWVGGAAVPTDARGRFRAAVPPGPSRALRLVLDQGPAVRCSRTLRLLVRAGVTLRARPRAVARGQRVRFSGRLRGRPARKRRLVVVQAYDGGRWRTFKTARTGRRGRWVAAYRFSSGAASRRYRFRAVVPRQAGYPYVRGTSRIRRVTLR